MIQTVRKAWAIPELRKKIIFTLLILLIYRIGNAITVPYVRVDALGTYLNSMGTTYLGLMNAMSGGAFATATVFALGIQPYINSSIIIQLLTVAIPALERLARDGGEEGKKKIQAITRYATVAIALLQAWGYYMLMKSNGLLESSGAGRAGQRVRYRQRYLHDPVRRYHLPDSPRGGQHGQRCDPLVRCEGWQHHPGVRDEHLWLYHR